MLKSEKHLRWLGIDMAPRWRRRVAVLVNYFALLWAIFTVTNGGYLGHPCITMLVLMAVILGLGVFFGRGPVKSFEVPPPSGEFMSKYVFVNGLDDLARYRYGVASYDAATPEQKSDLLQTYHVGTRLMPRKRELEEQTALNERDWVDEREKQERVLAERWARRWLLMIIAILAGQYCRRHTPVQPLEVYAELTTLFILASTLAPARILWTEPNPRTVAGEIELVSKEA